MKKAAILLFLTFILSALSPITYLLDSAYAFSMSNNDFMIDGNLNSGSGDASNTNHKVESTIGQTAPGIYGGKNYDIQAGFAYVSGFSGFSFTLTESAIDFGVLTATTPVTRTTNIKIANPGGIGFQVLAYEDHPLVAPNGASIPDTTCDNGLCTETTPTAWENTLTYGFGFRCDNVSGNDCPNGFGDSTSYKQFANNAKHELMQPVMIGKGSKNPEEKITYKINVSGTQAPGSYENSITYLAVPTY